MFTFVEESLLISFSVRFDLWSFYCQFTSKQCNVCLYFQLTTHLASCRENKNCDIKAVQLITGRSRGHYFLGAFSTWEEIHQRSISHREDHLGGKKTRTTDCKKERLTVFENLRHKEKTSQTKVQILWFFRFLVGYRDRVRIARQILCMKERLRAWTLKERQQFFKSQHDASKDRFFWEKDLTLSTHLMSFS